MVVFPRVDGWSTGPSGLGHHKINSILISVNLSYLEQLFLNSLHDTMISHNLCALSLHDT